MAIRMLLLVAIGELLGMTLWFSATAAVPAITSELHIGTSAAAWLTMAVQAGFVAGTLVSATLSLADVINARWLFAIGCAAGAAANAAIAGSDSIAVIVALRFVTGAALACVYPPGLKIAAGWFAERRGSAMGFLVGALTFGSSFPHLLAWAAADVPWRASMIVASTLALAGGGLVALTVSDGPYVRPSAPFDPHAVRRVMRDRGVRLAIFGYLGHMWELYAVWAWISAFATASLAASGSSTPRGGALLAFLTIAAGAVGCVIAGHWADRWGKARVAGGAMWASAACAAAAGLVYGQAPPLLVALGVVWGFAVVADSAQFSALVSEHAPDTHVGTALTLQICAGFLLTMVSVRVVPAVADAIGWQWAFVALVPGPLIGAAVMARMAVTSREA